MEGGEEVKTAAATFTRLKFKVGGQISPYGSFPRESQREWGVRNMRGKWRRLISGFNIFKKIPF